MFRTRTLSVAEAVAASLTLPRLQVGASLDEMKTGDFAGLFRATIMLASPISRLPWPQRDRRRRCATSMKQESFRWRRFFV